MPSPRLVYTLNDAVVVRGLRAIRTEQHIDDGFAPDVQAQADEAAKRTFAVDADRMDHRDIEFVTIDPEGSLDLDQAYFAQATADGFVVYYAIADVAAFVDLDTPLAASALARGVTLYAPDCRAPLYPPVLCEGAASLLPDVDRPALVWAISLDSSGAVRDAHVERGLVRSREKLSYVEAQRRIDGGTASASLQCLKAVGEARIQQEAVRGAVSLSLPEQELDRANGGYELRFRATLPVEKWNAQISLLTGIVAAKIMCEGHVGLLRTLPEPAPETVAIIRRAARALGIDWPDAMTYAERIASLDATNERHMALMHQAARLFRGAGYLAFDGVSPEHAEHSAIASTYAHVTAPLRRVGDRYANEVVLALAAKRPVPDAIRAALSEVPAALGRGQQRQNALDRAVLDLGEVLTMSGRIGQKFAASVVNIDHRRATVQIAEPAVVSDVEPRGLSLGDDIRVRLVSVDDKTRTVHFAVDGDRGSK